VRHCEGHDYGQVGVEQGLDDPARLTCVAQADVLSRSPITSTEPTPREVLVLMVRDDVPIRVVAALIGCAGSIGLRR
jgi:hypothetical protein